MFEEIVLSLNLPIYLFFLLTINIIGFFSFRKIIYSWFDPLLFYLLTNSFGTAFICYIFFVDKSISFFYFFIILLNIFFFSVGLVSGNSKINESQIKIDKNKVYKYSKWLNIALKLILLVLIISNLALIIKFGTPALFTENPSISKVEYRSGGFGLVFKIGEVLFPLSLSIIFLKLFHPFIQQPRHQSIFLLFSALLIFVLIALGGSKGGVFIVLDTLFYTYLINKFYGRKQRVEQVKKVSLMVLFTCILMLLIVLALTFRQSFSIVEGLMIRFIGSFDGIYFFSRFDLYPNFQYTPIDFLARLINPFLGFLRISEYQNGIGELIFEKATGFPVSGFGPNSTFILESLIFFGPYFSWLYCFLVGFLISFVRTSLLLKIVNDPTQLKLACYIISSIFILRLPVESNMIATAILGMVIFAFPIFVISGILCGIYAKRTSLRYAQNRHT